jgi:hypothetical protein
MRVPFRVRALVLSRTAILGLLLSLVVTLGSLEQAINTNTTDIRLLRIIPTRTLTIMLRLRLRHPARGPILVVQALAFLTSRASAKLVSILFLTRGAGNPGLNRCTRPLIVSIQLLLLRRALSFWTNQAGLRHTLPLQHSLLRLHPRRAQALHPAGHSISHLFHPYPSTSTRPLVHGTQTSTEASQATRHLEPPFSSRLKISVRPAHRGSLCPCRSLRSHLRLRSL